MKGYKTLIFALAIAVGGVLQAFDWTTIVPQDKTWSGLAMIAIAGIVAFLRTVTNTSVGSDKTIIKTLIIGFALSFLFLPSSSRAGDLAGPAAINKALTPWDSLAKGYPYGSSGLFFGIYTEGGAGSVNGSVAGVNSASLTTTQAGVGITVGYSLGWKNSPVAYSVEGDFGWTNFNGNSAGLALNGPAHFEQRVIAFTPLTTIMNLLPNLPNLGTVPPFQALPAGVTASNIQMGLMAGIDEDDISGSFPGVGSSRQWRAAPMIGLVAMEQLSNGSALRSWIKTVFPEKGVCVGALGNTCGNVGQQVKAGIGVYW